MSLFTPVAYKHFFVAMKNVLDQCMFHFENNNYNILRKFFFVSSDKFKEQ